MNRMKTKLLGFAAFIGAGLWLVRLISSEKARTEVDAAIRAIDEATD